MLALFIILFSISTINKVKLQRLVRDLGGGFNSQDAINNPPNGMTMSATKDQLQAMQAQLQSYITSNSLQSKVQTKIQREGQKRELVITLLSDKQLYDSGKADLKPETKRILDEVYKQLKATHERSARRRQHRQRADRERVRSPATGNSRRLALPAWPATSSRTTGSPHVASRRWGTVNTGRGCRTTPTPTGPRTGVSTS